MTLNRQSNLLSWIAAGASVVVLAIVAFSAIEVQRQTGQIVSAENTAIGITNLRYLIMETALYREQRSSDQWKNRVTSLKSILADSQYTTARENALVAKENANLDVLMNQYDKLRTIDTAMPLGTNEKNLNEKRTLGVLSALFLTTQDMLDDAFELVRMNRQDLIDSQNRAARSMLLGILLLCSLIVIAVLIVKKKVLVPIATFQAVVDNVTLGDLAVRVQLDGTDEIGQLAASFNNMTGRLEASHEALEIENIERLHAQADLKNTIDALALARDEAEGASRAKSQFLANISHEIRTPMNAVLGMLQLLQNTELTALQKDYAGNTLAAARSLLGLLNDILDFSKIEAEKLTLEEAPFSLEQLLRDLSVILAGSLGDKNVELLFIVDPALPAFVSGDMHRLRQVLLNLISNAIKFTERGEVTVRLEPAPTAAEPGQVAIRFEVTDTGMGIQADKIDAIFEGFTQAEASTTRRFGGTGLGLAISQRLVGLMGGALGVESRLDVGSRFHFTITFANAVATPAADLRVDAALQKDLLRVLIVDDHAGSREVLLALVSRFGWEAHSASTGVEALAMIEKSADDGLPYNAVLVDWKMPQMDGWEVARRIRQLPRGDTAQVIIMVTAHERSALAARQAHEKNLLNGFLSKPVTASLLADTVLDAISAGSAERFQHDLTNTSKALQGLKLLVVDDNPMNQRVACELLAAQGAQVQVAGGGIAAQQLALGDDAPFDAILMDIQMPDMDGYDTTRALRQHASMRTVPIIAMTANVMASDKVLCLQAGMNDHIAKPFDLQVVIETILRHCEPVGQPAVAAAGDRPAGAADGVQDLLMEIDRAIARLGGNLALFGDVAAKFVDTAAPAGQALCGMLLRGEHEAAANALHTLKGSAGLVGAAALQRQVARLESGLRTASATTTTTTSNAADLAHFTELLEKSCAALEVYLGAGEVKAPSKVRSACPAGELLPELVTLLEQANMRAPGVFEAFEAAWGTPAPAALVAASAAMATLDFKSALQCVRQLPENP